MINDTTGDTVWKCIDMVDNLWLEAYEFTEEAIAKMSEKITGRENLVGKYKVWLFSSS